MAKYKLKRDQYQTVGGPLRCLYLPWPHKDVPAHEHLPERVPMGDGSAYLRHKEGDSYVYRYAADQPPAQEGQP